MYTVMPRIEPPGLYLFLEVKSGDSIQWGDSIRGGGIKFFPEGAKFFTFLYQKYAFFMLFDDEMWLLLLIKYVHFY